MTGLELPELVRHWVNDILVWIGFGTVVGLLSKAILPGKDNGGALATVLLGIAGSVIGSGTLMLTTNGVRVTPISLLGFLVATAGAFGLLLFYRLMTGGLGPIRIPGSPRGRRRVSKPQHQ